MEREDMPGKCKQNPCASKPKPKPASAELFMQLPFKQSPGPLLRQLPSNWLQLKATFRVSQSRRAHESAWESGCVCVVHKHPVGGTLVTAERVFSSLVWALHLRLMQMCGFSLRPPARKRFLSICTSMFFDTQRIHLDAGSPPDLHSFTKLSLGALSHTFSHSRIRTNGHEPAWDEFRKNKPYLNIISYKRT